MKVFSYWRAIPATQENLEQLTVEAADLQVIKVGESFLLLRNPQASASS
jgi:hypothetical protein